MYATATMRVIVHALIIFGGSVFLGGALTNLKKEQFGGFGMNMMLTILMIKLMWSI